MQRMTDVPAYFREALDDPAATARFAADQLDVHGLHLVTVEQGGAFVRLHTEPVAAPLATWKPLERLSENANPSAVRQEAERLAQMEGAAIVGLDVIGNRVQLSPMVPDDVRIRDIIATRLQTEPWNVKVAVRRHVDGHIDDITVWTRAGSKDPDKALEDWQFIVGELPGGSNGWRIHQDRENGVTVLTWGPVRSLPPTVPLASILPSCWDRGNWRRIPLGLDSTGKVIAWEPGEIPHTLIAGPTGAGKSIQLSSMLAAWVACGGRYVVIDPVRSAADFVAVKPGASAWAVTLADAADVLTELYAEGQRRKQLWLDYEKSKWSDLPREVIEAENIWPILVVIDEYISLVTAEPEQKELGKDHPLLIASQTANRHRATIRAMVDKIARELRPAGINLAIATQRPDVDKDGLSGSTRAQLSNAIQLQAPGRTLDAATLGMTMKADDLQAARDEFRALDDKKSKGLAVISAEGVITGYRVAFAEIADIPGILANIGVPLVPPPVVFGQAARAAAGGAPTAAQASAPVSPPPVFDVGSLLEI